VKLPGFGLSQPVVVGDELLVTAAVSDKLSKPTGVWVAFGEQDS
jgi:hypothetical protein